MQANNIIAQVLERMLPVGSIVEWSPVDGGKADLSSADKVAAYYGFGTWEAYGSGRMLLGVSDSHAVETTGGEEAHDHGLNNAVACIGISYNTSTQKNIIMNLPKSSPEAYTSRYMDDLPYYTQEKGQTQGSAIKGTTDSASSMPPYIAVYRWRRIA